MVASLVPNARRGADAQGGRSPPVRSPERRLRPIRKRRSAVPPITAPKKPAAPPQRKRSRTADRPPIPKPDLGGGLSHPARFSPQILELIATFLPPNRYDIVLDPFAGTGKIHQLANRTLGIEIEPEWARLHADTLVGDATKLPFADGSLDAVATSPTYANRLADNYRTDSAHTRRSYRFDLGRDLHTNNSGQLQWGPAYREMHQQAWAEAHRVLRPAGRLIVNVKDHVRAGVVVPVTAFHIETVTALGFVLVEHAAVPVRSLRVGANAGARVATESVLVFDRP